MSLTGVSSMIDRSSLLDRGGRRTGLGYANSTRFSRRELQNSMWNRGTFMVWCATGYHENEKALVAVLMVLGLDYDAYHIDSCKKNRFKRTIRTRGPKLESKMGECGSETRTSIRLSCSVTAHTCVTILNRDNAYTLSSAHSANYSMSTRILTSGHSASIKVRGAVTSVQFCHGKEDSRISHVFRICIWKHSRKAMALDVQLVPGFFHLKCLPVILKERNSSPACTCLRVSRLCGNFKDEIRSPMPACVVGMRQLHPCVVRNWNIGKLDV